MVSLDDVWNLTSQYRNQFLSYLNLHVDKTDVEIQNILLEQEHCALFAIEFPYLFKFVCSSKTTDDNMRKLKSAIDVKKRVALGDFSDEEGKQIVLSKLF